MTINSAHLSFTGVAVSGLKNKPGIEKLLSESMYKVSKKLNADKDIPAGALQPFYYPLYLSKGQDRVVVSSALIGERADMSKSKYSPEQLRNKYDQLLFKAWSNLAVKIKGLKVKVIPDSEATSYIKEKA